MLRVQIHKRNENFQHKTWKYYIHRIVHFRKEKELDRRRIGNARLGGRKNQNEGIDNKIIKKRQIKMKIIFSKQVQSDFNRRSLLYNKGSY